jgi:hypothetical protein
MGERTHPTLGQLAEAAVASAIRFRLVVDSYRAGTITEPAMLLKASATMKSQVWAACSTADVIAREDRNNV